MLISIYEALTHQRRGNSRKWFNSM